MKQALITGASEGIGRAFALRLAKEGYNLTLVARNESRLRDFNTETQGDHKIIVADLSTDSGIQKIVDEVTATHYDLLLNNAGAGFYGAFTDVPLEDHHKILTLNCKAVVDLSYAYLKKSKSGDALINVSSTLAFLPMPIAGVYSATKAFVTSFSESLWFEQKKRGVYVMNLCPGITATNFHARSGGKPNELPAMLTQQPDQVVATAMAALAKRGRPTVISGGTNKAMATVARLIPRKATVSAMGQRP